MAQRLVVVGNGMAGIRAIEEVSPAPAATSSRSPCSVTSRTATTTESCCRSACRRGRPEEIYLNALDWYGDNGSDLRAGVRVVRIDTFPHVVHADDGTSIALRQADSRHGQ